MAAIRVARRVGVVLEQVDVTADALISEPLLGVYQQVFQHPFAGAVVGDQLHQAVAFGGGVLRVASDVEIQAGSVAKEDVGASAPGHDATEQVAGHLVRAEPSMAVECAGDPELGLDAHDSPLHTLEGTGCWRDCCETLSTSAISAARRPHARRHSAALHHLHRCTSTDLGIR